MVMIRVSALPVAAMDAGRREGHGGRASLEERRARVGLVVCDLDALLHADTKDDGACSCTESSHPCALPRLVRPTRHTGSGPSAVNLNRAANTESLPPRPRQDIAREAEQHGVDEPGQHEHRGGEDGDGERDRGTSEG